MPNRKKTKIIATLGPATSSKEIMKKMMEAGVDVFRINFSHASHDEIKDQIQTIRSLNNEFGYNTAMLADLQGPKLRIGRMAEEVIVNEGDEIAFITGDPFEGNARHIYMNYETFPKDVNAGERILLDDGKLIFEVISTDKKKTGKYQGYSRRPAKIQERSKPSQYLCFFTGTNRKRY